MKRERWATCLRILITSCVLFAAQATRAEGQSPAPSFAYVWAKAYHVPPETTTEESGYFSLCEGRNDKIYIGTAAYGRNSYLVEFDPTIEKMRIALDIHKLAGLPLTPLHVIMAMIVARDGTIYATTIYPFTLLKIETVELFRSQPGGKSPARKGL